MKFKCLFVLVFIVLCLAPAWASGPGVQKVRLDNGLTVIIHEMPSSPVVAVFAWVKTGSANEGKYLGSGVTHFLEHMIFKGTARRGPGAIPQEAKAMGGDINASTGYDHTVFTLAIPRESFVRGLDLIADMVQNPVIDPQELERERAVILNEIRMVNDKPERRLSDLVYAAVYKVHPYQHPIIGREKIFSALTREDVLDYYRSFYVPNNMILVVSGGIKGDEALSEIKKVFGQFSPRPFLQRVLPQEPQQISSRWEELDYSTDLLRVTMAYQGVPLLHPDLYALDVLAMALGNGQSSRLYLDLYKRRHIVESVEASNNTPQDRGFFEISCLSSKDNAREIVERARTLIDELKQRGLDPAELAKVKRQVLAENIRGRETAVGMAYRLGLEEMYTGDHLFSDKYLAGVRRVTNEDIRRVAREYLKDDCLSVGVLKPKAAAVASVAPVAARQEEMEKVLLPNGLTLLLKEDRSIPLASVTVSIGGGGRQEPVELNGLSELTARAWARGYEGRTADQISREIESRGAWYSISSGRNSFILSFSGLSGDLPFFLEQAEAFIKRPTFPQDEFGKEKDQMLTAIKARKDSISQTSIKALRETLFLTHPFRLDSLGSEETLARIRRKDLVAFYGRFLSPSNMVIAVAGDIDKSEVKKELVARFGGLKPKRVDLSGAREPVPDAPRLKELEMDKEQAMVLYGFRAPTIHDQDKYAMETAVNILSSSFGGRLFRRIRDDLGKAYTLGGSYSPGVDAGMAAFYVLTTNENIEKVKDIIERELSSLREAPVNDSELADAKAYLKADQARDLETVSAQAGVSAVDELLGLGFDNYKAYNSRIDAVTKDDVQAAARRYLDPAHGAVVITRSRQAEGDGKNRE